jgi:hypothetical protein
LQKGLTAFNCLHHCPGAGHFVFWRAWKSISRPDVEKPLRQVAIANGKDAEQLVKETVARMLENQTASSRVFKKVSNKPTVAS